MDQLANRSDAELLKLALAGDEHAFVALYERLKSGIYRYAFYMTSSKSTAEEVTQEVFVSLLRADGGYRAELGELAGFAFGIARNFIRRIERRERPYQALPSDDALHNLTQNLVPESEGLYGRMVRDEVVQRVQTAIHSLPDHYRQVVVLCDLCGLTYVEAAARLRCAVGTVRSRLHRAHEVLALKLRPFKKTYPDIEAADTEGCVI